MQKRTDSNTKKPYNRFTSVSISIFCVVFFRVKLLSFYNICFLSETFENGQYTFAKQQVNTCRASFVKEN